MDRVYLPLVVGRVTIRGLAYQQVWTGQVPARAEHGDGRLNRADEISLRP
jgi:hypothetical protein